MDPPGTTIVRTCELIYVIGKQKRRKHRCIRTTMSTFEKMIIGTTIIVTACAFSFTAGIFCIATVIAAIIIWIPKSTLKNLR